MEKQSMTHEVKDGRKKVAIALIEIYKLKKRGLNTLDESYMKSLGVLTGALALLGEETRLDTPVHRLYTGTEVQTQEALIYLTKIAEGQLS